MIYCKITDIACLKVWCKNKPSQIEIDIPEMVIQRKKNLNMNKDSEKGKKVTDETV